MTGIDSHPLLSYLSQQEVLMSTVYLFTAEMLRSEGPCRDPSLVINGIRGPFNRAKTVVFDPEELRALMRKCGQVVIGG